MKCFEHSWQSTAGDGCQKSAAQDGPHCQPSIYRQPSPGVAFILFRCASLRFHCGYCDGYCDATVLTAVPAQLRLSGPNINVCVCVCVCVCVYYCIDQIPRDDLLVAKAGVMSRNPTISGWMLHVPDNVACMHTISAHFSAMREWVIDWYSFSNPCMWSQ